MPRTSTGNRRCIRAEHRQRHPSWALQPVQGEFSLGWYMFVWYLILVCQETLTSQEPIQDKKSNSICDMSNVYKCCMHAGFLDRLTQPAGFSNSISEMSENVSGFLDRLTQPEGSSHKRRKRISSASSLRCKLLVDCKVSVRRSMFNLIPATLTFDIHPSALLWLQRRWCVIHWHFFMYY